MKSEERLQNASVDAVLTRPFLESHGGRFTTLQGDEGPMDYGDWRREYELLREGAGLIDLSFRGRLCLVGSDAQRFLNGQVTNNVKDLAVGQGIYAALVSAKGKMQSDLFIYRLENEMLLDFEPGLSLGVKERLEKFVIAEDVQIVDVAPMYGLWRAQGPKAREALGRISWLGRAPEQDLEMKTVAREGGDVYWTFHAGPPGPAFDLFVPSAEWETVGKELMEVGTRLCGWRALETARIEATAPRFGVDMDGGTLPPEAGLENRAISYAKGCYIGQEVIARIRTYGQVARTLRGLKLPATGKLPERGAKLFKDEKEVGRITSAGESPTCQTHIALGYVRREANAIGTELWLEIEGKKVPAMVATRPFEPFSR